MASQVLGYLYGVSSSHFLLSLSILRSWPVTLSRYEEGTLLANETEKLILSFNESYLFYL